MRGVLWRRFKCTALHQRVERCDNAKAILFLNGEESKLGDWHPDAEAILGRLRKELRRDAVLKIPANTFDEEHEETLLRERQAVASAFDGATRKARLVMDKARAGNHGIELVQHRYELRLWVSRALQ